MTTPLSKIKGRSNQQDHALLLTCGAHMKGMLHSNAASAARSVQQLGFL